MTERWIVIENTPGYLPEDDDPGIFDDLQDAKEYAKEAAQRLYDDMAQNDAYHTINKAPGPDGMSWEIWTDSPHDLGRVITVNTYSEEDN